MSHLSHCRAASVLLAGLFIYLFSPSWCEAAVTLAWDKPTSNEDGTPCRDLAGYNVYYDTDYALAPYHGTGLVQGNSPINVPVSSLADPEQPELVLSGMSPSATYHLTVTAYDTAGNESGYSNVIAIAPNNPPSATVTVTPTQGSAPLTVSFSASGTDTDGTVVSYGWTFGDGMEAVGQNTTHTYGTPGSYTAALTVTDNDGLTDTRTIQIVVSEPPISGAIITPTPPTGAEDENPTVTAGAYRHVFGNVTSADFPGRCQDTYLNAGQPDLNRARSALGLNTYTWPTDTDANRILMRFDLSPVPGNATITSATLSLYMFKAGGDTAYELPVHKITGIQPEVSRATWNSADGTAPWTGGRDGGARNLEPPEDASIIDTTPGYKHWTVTRMVQEWVADPASNAGLMITSDTTARLYSHRYFYPSEYADDSVRPKLVVHYTVGTSSNQRPLADAGPDHTVTQAQLSTESVQVSLDGSLSSDPEGAPLRYAWRQIAGSPVNLMGADSAAPLFTVTSALAGQTLRFELTVNDGQLDSDPAFVAVTVNALLPPPNVPPTVQVGANPTAGMAPLTVAFAGSATDGDGAVTSFSWHFGDGQTAATQRPTHSYSEPGTYTAVFTATDDDGATANGQIQIVVAAPPENAPPTVSLAANPESGEAPVRVDFTASATDSDGTIASYHWLFGDGTTSQAANPSHTYAEAGSYSATLTVTDNSGATAMVSTTIVVTAPPPNAPPSVSVSADPTTGPVPLTVSFRCTASDSDGRVTEYLWMFGDGSTSQNAQPDHQYLTAGHYTASLTVTDDHGGRTTRTIPIYVEEIAPDLDSDQDGLSDAQETANGLNPNASDTDGDGIEDFLEWGPGAAAVDTDGDGVIDALDADSDNDGAPDAAEGSADSDKDGAPNYIDIVEWDGPRGDQDYDGVNNSTETTYMMNPNRPDSDGDGLSDGWEFGSFGWPLDTDGDGIIDALDADSDNDGAPDAAEGLVDTDGDGAPDCVDAVDTDGPGADQDGDAITNIAETNIGLNPNLRDSDSDGIPDHTETLVPNAPPDTDGDGLTDGVDRDSDDDGVPDAVEGFEDFDLDGLADRLDSRIATLWTDTGGRMALRIAIGGGRLSEMELVRDPVPDELWETVKESRFGGVSFEVRDVTRGGAVDLEVIMDEDISPEAQYLKLDPAYGYYEMDATVSGRTLTVTLTDGGLGDNDRRANGVIVDPAVIAIPEAAVPEISSE